MCCCVLRVVSLRVLLRVLRLVLQTAQLMKKLQNPNCASDPALIGEDAALLTGELGPVVAGLSDGRSVDCCGTTLCVDQIVKAGWQGQMSKLSGSVGQLTPELVVLLGGAGRDVWAAGVAILAKDCEERGDAHTAVMYWLAVDEPHKAVQCYMRALLFKDAAVLARTRLASGDPLLTELYSKWGHHQAHNGAVEAAAKCFIAAGDPARAVTMLLRRANCKSVEPLRVAALISAATDNASRASELWRQHALHCQAAHQWQDARESFDQAANSSSELAVLCVDQQLSELLKTPQLGDTASTMSLSACEVPTPSVASHYKQTEAGFATVNFAVLKSSCELSGWSRCVLQSWQASGLDDATMRQANLTAAPGSQTQLPMLVAAALRSCILQPVDLRDGLTCWLQAMQLVAGRGQWQMMHALLSVVLPAGNGSLEAWRAVPGAEVEVQALGAWHAMCCGWECWWRGDAAPAVAELEGQLFHSAAGRTAMVAQLLLCRAQSLAQPAASVKSWLQQVAQSASLEPTFDWLCRSNARTPKQSPLL